MTYEVKDIFGKDGPKYLDSCRHTLNQATNEKGVTGEVGSVGLLTTIDRSSQLHANFRRKVIGVLNWVLISFCTVFPVDTSQS